MTVVNMEAVLAMALSPKTPTLDTKDLTATPKGSTLFAAIPLSLKCVRCIYYPLYFRKNKNNIEILIDSGSDIKAITLAYTKKQVV